MHPVKIFLTVFALALPLLVADLASAGERYRRDRGFFSEHPKSDTYRRTKPQVRGYRKRVGGYSYGYKASEGSGFFTDRQGGPFDSGFFFDSNFGTPGEAPYMN